MYGIMNFGRKHRLSPGNGTRLALQHFWTTACSNVRAVGVSEFIKPLLFSKVWSTFFSFFQKEFLETGPFLSTTKRISTICMTYPGSWIRTVMSMSPTVLWFFALSRMPIAWNWYLLYKEQDLDLQLQWDFLPLDLLHLDLIDPSDFLSLDLDLEQLIPDGDLDLDFLDLDLELGLVYTWSSVLDGIQTSCSNQPV